MEHEHVKHVRTSLDIGEDMFRHLFYGWQREGNNTVVIVPDGLQWHLCVDGMWMTKDFPSCAIFPPEHGDYEGPGKWTAISINKETDVRHVNQFDSETNFAEIEEWCVEIAYK